MKPRISLKKCHVMEYADFEECELFVIKKAFKVVNKNKKMGIEQ
jgi:hypothetical protein